MLCYSHQVTTELQWFVTTKVYVSSSYLSQIGYVHAILIQRPKDLAGLLEENKVREELEAMHGLLFCLGSTRVTCDQSKPKCQASVRRKGIYNPLLGISPVRWGNEYFEQ